MVIALCTWSFCTAIEDRATTTVLAAQAHWHGFGEKKER